MFSLINNKTSSPLQLGRPDRVHGSVELAHIGLYSMMRINVGNNGTTADKSRNTNPFFSLILHYIYIYFSSCSHPCSRYI